mgnify:FL=1
MLRGDNGWNYSNALTLLQFSEKNKYKLDFQLGNEPNSFEHVFNVSISGTELAKDFNVLRKLLNSFKSYKTSLLIGPDVTRPKHLEYSSLNYLKEFLSHTKSISAASWHQ